MQLSLTIAGVPRFLPGNANGDLQVDLSDSMWLLNELFEDGAASPCRAASDINGDEIIDISDPIWLLNYLFLGGLPPRAPFPGCASAETSMFGCDVPQGACETTQFSESR